jgi:hypothetical protein
MSKDELASIGNVSKSYLNITYNDYLTELNQWGTALIYFLMEAKRVQGKITRVDKKKQKQDERRKRAQARGQKPIR